MTVTNDPSIRPRLPPKQSSKYNSCSCTSTVYIHLSTDAFTMHRTQTLHRRCSAASHTSEQQHTLQSTPQHDTRATLNAETTAYIKHWFMRMVGRAQLPAEHCNRVRTYRNLVV